MTITIHNLRLGFATNSSSSHSIVIMPEGEITTDQIYDKHSYNWEQFRLASVEAKMRYVGAQLLGGLDGEERERVISMIERDVPSYREEVAALAENGDSWNNEPSVDHQSQASGVFNDTLVRLLHNDRVIIFGGNDNGGDANIGNGQTLLDLSSSREVKMREDGDYIVVFNREEGTKARMSFNRNAPEYVKSSAPELVDLKITNWCDKGCRFCYQSSTTDGVHAPLDRIKTFLDLLGEMKVFEVALGGGEPTAHPDFIEIIRYARERGVVPNFTTLSGKWLQNKELVEAVKRNVGGIGVSCASAKNLDLAQEINEAMPYSVKVMAQHVVGAQPLGVTAKLIEQAVERRISLLLLGYKEVGFGAEFERHDRGDAEVFLKLALAGYARNTYRPLSVDTALLDQYPGILTAVGAPEVLASSPEGKFSCYVDAVEDTMAASSYVAPSDMVPARHSVEEFKEVYAEF